MIKNHLFWSSLIYIEKYNATRKDRMEYPARPKILFFDVAFGLMY